jgi:hypothetical protein
MTSQTFIKWGIANPNKLFLFDVIGAILSAFLLGFVLVELEHYFGIPITTLYFLALLPCLFALYDFYSYYSNSKRVNVLLKGIAIMNFAYCFLSLALLIYHYEIVKVLGVIYIVIEVIIVWALASIEYKVATDVSIKAAN